MSRNLGKSIGAVIAGFLATAVLSTATDAVLHAVGFYPPMPEPLTHGTALVALGYRTLFSVFGAWLTARLAPARPMQHALALGGVGVFFASLGVLATLGQDLGPTWYPVSLAVLAIPQCWLGGQLRVAQLTPAPLRA